VISVRREVFMSAADDDYEFTSDWLTDRLPIWRVHIEPLRGLPLQALELGCYEGRASVWLLQNVLTDPRARLTVVDTFEGSAESGTPAVEGLLERFMRNIGRAGGGSKVRALRTSTVVGLAQLIVEAAGTPSFDLIYVDASHRADDVLGDAVLSFHLLKPGGVLILDDYRWDWFPSELDRPKIAIDAFMQIFERSLEVLEIGYQVLVRKLSERRPA
jgi:predicted O-methyltransferase YrrM